jgi:PRC-barrel domain
MLLAKSARLDGPRLSREEALMRTYYHFRSGADPTLQAFTDDPTADRLPAENRPWTFVAKVSPDEDWAYGPSKAAVAAGVLENGFFLWGVPNQPSSKPVIESDRVEGTAVYDPAGHRIGTIKRLLIEKVSGRVTYGVMTFGGFLGIGAHEHTIPWNKLSYDTRLNGYRTDITEEQLRGAPPLYGDGEVWPDRKREKELRDYWDVPPRF